MPEPSQTKPNPDHYDECPVNTGDGPSWAPHKCRCDAINAEQDGYDSEPSNMFEMEWGSY